MLYDFFYSGSRVLDLGYSAVRYGSENTVGFQRKSIHFYRHIQRVHHVRVPQRVDVSVISNDFIKKKNST